MGGIVAFVSQQSKSPTVVLFYMENFCHTCKKIISEFVFFMYLIDEVVAQKFMNWLKFKV